jgi:hypothetical protein
VIEGRGTWRVGIEDRQSEKLRVKQEGDLVTDS